MLNKTFQSTLPARGATLTSRAARTQAAFQSTLPARGATPQQRRQLSAPCHFNPRSPHGERRSGGGELPGAAAHFNPRSPHGERLDTPPTFTPEAEFQSTLPARGATTDFCGKVACVLNFNPRSPHGERRERSRFCPVCVKFQSTLPARGATASNRRKKFLQVISIHAPRTGSDIGDGADNRRREISIHAPRTGSDPCKQVAFKSQRNFNPRSPHGERRAA